MSVCVSVCDTQAMLIRLGRGPSASDRSTSAGATQTLECRSKSLRMDSQKWCEQEQDRMGVGTASRSSPCPFPSVLGLPASPSAPVGPHQCSVNNPLPRVAAVPILPTDHLTVQDCC